VQLVEVLSGGSYLSQNDLRVHFGLADYPKADKAEVLWPDGKVETFTALTTGRYYSIREGAGIVPSLAPRTNPRSSRTSEKP